MPVLPAHTSHLLQPLDLAVFGAFKTALSKGDSGLRQLTLQERRSSLMRKAIRSLHVALSVEVVLRSWKLSGLWPFEPSIPLQHPCVLLKQEQEPLKIDVSTKGHNGRYSINGKVITNFAEIEAIRGVEDRRKKVFVAKVSAGQMPVNTTLVIDPLANLPPAPKRRGRPPKVKEAPAILVSPAIPQVDAEDRRMVGETDLCT